MRLSGRIQQGRMFFFCGSQFLILWSVLLFVIQSSLISVSNGQQHQQQQQQQIGSSNGATQTCPLRCLCFRTTVRCMFLHLEKIPQVPADTTILDLRFNRIREIPPNSLRHLTQLGTLLLNNNHITRLENGAFNGLDQLKFLYLYKNRIRRVDPQVFQGLGNLEQLYLHYNLIQDFQPATFSNLTKLERLFLHNNRIQRIPHGSFDNLHEMKRLRLDSNALVCDCGMVGLAQMLVEHPDTQAAATCQQPASMQGKPITALKEMKLHCRKPIIMEEPRDVEVNFGSTVYFHCKAEGDPTPEIVWLHNSNEISPGREPRYSVLTDGTLMIANAQDEDAGAYECMAKSMVGEAKSRRAKMQYRKPVEKVRPRFLQVPTDSEVQMGGDVVLNCEATGGQISWAFNDQPLAITSRHEVSRGGSLTIRRVVSKDGGVYRCIAANTVGKIASVAEVRIIVPPIWSITPWDQSVQLHGTAEFKCEATGKPLPTITWTRNGRPVVSGGRVHLINGGQRLRLKSVTVEDESEFMCRVENPGGFLESTAILRIIPGTPPVFTQNFDLLNRWVETGRQIQLDCSAVGLPNPQIVWRKNGLTVLENSRTVLLPSGTLVINRFNPEFDAGLYDCIAFNEHGLVTSPRVTIERNSIRVEVRESVDDSTILRAVAQARRDIETAENDSVEYLRNMSKTEIRSPADLLRLSRFPKAEARNIARSAEIYERALQLIAQHAETMNFSLSDEFSYNDLLTSNQLETLGRFSGCIGHRKPKTNCSLEMCFHSRYRSIDGTCNNLGEPMWGTSYTPFQRILPAVYENGFNLPIGWSDNKLYNGFKKPLARHVSNEIISTDNVSPDSTYTHMLMQWGQFLDHDLDHSLPSLSIESFGERVSCRRTCENVAPCFPMQAPEGDHRVRTRRCMEFTRSAAVCGSGITSVIFDRIQQREQINQLTAFIDASQVYGSSEEELRSLRSTSNRILLRHGIYMASNKPLMPFATDETPVDCRKNHLESDIGCFLGGDIRANEQLGLLAMHTIWFRQHNFLAEKLRNLNPTWDDEVVFQETRKIVGAQMQHITYAHWLPYVVGQRGMELLGPYEGYKPEVNPMITNEFATAALRFGHTLINPILRRLDANFRTVREGDVPLRQAFFAPWRLVEEGGVDPLMRGLFSTPAKLKTPDQLLNSHLTDDLFTAAHFVALDLAAMNIQRGRDHGLPSYNDYRVWCNLTRAQSFDDLSSEIRDAGLRRKLAAAYGHVDNIDLWVGGVAEDFEWDDARVGPTFRCILIDQFRRLRDGDRFWYENPSVFRPEQLTAIKQTSLARILCDNGDGLSHAKRDVFHMESGLVRCDSIPSVQLAFWSTGCCGSTVAPFPYQPATCPILQSANKNDDVESNTIRIRRDVSDYEDAAGNFTINDQSSDNEQLSNAEPDVSKIKQLEETLSRVTSTVNQLKDQIQELQVKCDKGGGSTNSSFIGPTYDMNNVDATAGMVGRTRQ